MKYWKISFYTLGIIPFVHFFVAQTTETHSQPYQPYQIQRFKIRSIRLVQGDFNGLRSRVLGMSK